MRPLFTFGRITKAVAGAIESVASAEVFVEPVRFDGHGPAVAILYAEEGEDGETLLEDPLVLARASPSGTSGPGTVSDLLRGPILVPALPGPVARPLRAALDGRDVTFLDEEPGALPRLAAERPDAAFAVPASLLSERLGLPRFRAAPLDPPLTATIVARGGTDTTGRAIVAAIRDRLAASDGATPFRPVLTLRGLRAFEAVGRLRGVMAAARGLGVAQPAVTEALRRMERALGAPLFERRRDGLLPTTRGERLRAAAPILSRLMADLDRGRAAAPGDRGGRIGLGLPPSAGPDDPLSGRVAAAIAAWRAAHPGARLRVTEAPSASLHALIRDGSLDLAVAEWAPSHMARLPLAPCEPLVALAAPGRALPSPLSLEDLARLPLILPGAGHGIRRVLDEAARTAGLRLHDVTEVASPALALALAREGAAVAVLPASALAGEAGVVAVPLAFPATRALLVVHGGERPLTEAERALVAALRTALRALRTRPEVEVTHAP